MARRKETTTGSRKKEKRRTRERPAAKGTPRSDVRLQKVLAAAGVASRRGGERLILEGRVTVNGRVVDRLGVRVDPERDVVKVNGRRLPPEPAVHAYYILHKPRGCVTTLADPEGRPTVRDLLRGIRRRVYPVGRLDFNTEGLLLLTDDGKLARDLMHPRRKVPKTYLARVRGHPDTAVFRRLRAGVILDGRRTLPAQVRLARSAGKSAWVEITVVEGRKHQIRRMLEKVGHPVSRLRRVTYAGLRLDRLPAGKFRALTLAEVEQLRARAAGARGSRAELIP